MNKQKLYKATELAEILGVHLQTVYRMSYRNEIKSIKVGATRRFLMPDGIVVEEDEDK